MGSNLEEPIRKKTFKPKCERANGKGMDLKCFQPSDWLSSIKPRKLPFHAQIGDEVMYFRQGHEIYVAAVEHKNLYVINPNSLPWTKNIIRQQEWVKIIGIKYEIKPPRLVCLKLGIIDPISGVLTRKCFSIEYHDIDEVPDFLVLKQEYDVAISRPWKRSQQFRSLMNDDCGVQMWWEGKFIKKEPLDVEFPESTFLCCCITWDNGDRDRLSPWDLENIDPNRRPLETGTSVQLLPIEISSRLYTPTTDDWPPLGDRDFECDRISGGMGQVMSLYLAKHFSEPVNLELFPNYAYVVKYPIDLSTIKARLDHRFYRRATAVEFDVSRIRTNALKFNDPEKSDIVRNSSIITDLCLEIIRNSHLDIAAFYLQLMEKYKVRGIKVKGSIGKQPIAKRQIEQSSSFALTVTNVVAASSQTSASVQKSRPKLVFNSSQGSSPLVSSNHISVKISSSFTVDQLISDVGLTATHSHEPDASLNHQNDHNSETFNASRMRKKVTSPVGTEVELSPKRRKKAPSNTPAVICSDDQFSDPTIQECDDSVVTQINRNASLTRKSSLKSKTKENLDVTCTTTSSLPGIDDDDAQADVTTKSEVHFHNDCSSIDISQERILSPRVINKHLNLTRIGKKKMDTSLITLKETPVIFTPFLTPMPIAISTPIQVHRRQSSLFKNNNSLRVDKRASENVSRNSFGTEKRSNHKKLKLSSWSITFDDRKEGLVHNLSNTVSQEKTCLLKQGLTIFKKADLGSCYQSNTILHQIPEVKTTSPLLIAQETSTPDKVVIASYSTVSSLNNHIESKLLEHSIRTKCPPSTVPISSNSNAMFSEESKSSSSQSVDSPIKNILSESKHAILKQKSSNKSEKKKKERKILRLSNEDKDCKESLQAKFKYRKKSTRTKDTSTLSVILLEKDQKQSLNKEVTLTPTNFVDSESCERDLIFSTVEEMPNIERQDNVASNKFCFVGFEAKVKSSKATGPYQRSVLLKGSEFPSPQSVDALIEQILAKSAKRRVVPKRKTSKNKSEKKKKDGTMSSISRLSKVNNDCPVPFEAKSKYIRNDTRNKDSFPSSVIPNEDENKLSVNKEVILTPTNLVDSDSRERNGLFSTVKVPTVEGQCDVATNKSSPKGKDKSLKVTCHQLSVLPKGNKSSLSRSADALIKQILDERTTLKQKSSKSKSEKKKIEVNQKKIYPEESELPSSQSTDALIEQILAETNRSILKQKISKNKSEKKKKESRLLTFPNLSIIEKDCQEQLKTSTAFPRKENQGQLLRKIAPIPVYPCRKDRLAVKAKVSLKKSSFTGTKVKLCKLTGANQHSIFPEEGKSSSSQSDEEIIQQIITESKRSILKQNISQKNTTVTSRLLNDCQELQKKRKNIGSEKNPPNYSKRTPHNKDCR